MTSGSPVQVEVLSPPRFDRVQVVLRIVLAMVLAWLGITAGWLAWLLFGALPLVAAITLSANGERYGTVVGPRVWSALSYLLQLSAYMTMLVDRFPLKPDEPVRTEIRFTGPPTVGSALLRLVTSIPSAIVLALLGVVSGILWVIGAIWVLLTCTMPDAILGFQRGMLRWEARLLAYHASLVEEYPPFSFDTAAQATPPVATTMAV